MTVKLNVSARTSCLNLRRELWALFSNRVNNSCNLSRSRSLRSSSSRRLTLSLAWFWDECLKCLTDVGRLTYLKVSQQRCLIEENVPVISAAMIHSLIRIEMLKVGLTLVLVVLKSKKRHHMLPIERTSDLLLVEASHLLNFAIRLIIRF